MGKYIELTSANFEEITQNGISMVDFGLHGVDLVE